MEKVFLNDQQLFSGPSRQYLEERYGRLIAFLDKELAHRQVSHKQSDEFFARYTWFGLLITALSLLLNLSWWTNWVTITTSFISAWFASMTLPSRYLIITIANCSCGIALILIHFTNLVMLLLVAKKSCSISLCSTLVRITKNDLINSAFILSHVTPRSFLRLLVATDGIKQGTVTDYSYSLPSTGYPNVVPVC
jgi:hypothetical protein